jgi:hypothetical protein
MAICPQRVMIDRDSGMDAHRGSAQNHQLAGVTRLRIADQSRDQAPFRPVTASAIMATPRSTTCVDGTTP